jgi:hypothetical protein
MKKMPKLRRVLIALGLNILSWLIFMAVVLLLYFGFIRNMQMTWGATGEDVARPMMGDELLVNPEFNSTRAVEINAPPEDIWPWIVQIGNTRAGFYGFDNLDNGGNPSADSILPEYQSMQAGDSIPGGVYKGNVWYLMEVREVDPGKEMLWVFIETPWKGATWSWGLYRIDDNRTKLVSRLRQTYTFDSFQQIIPISLIDVCEVLMMRTTLRGIKYRAERINRNDH